QNFVCQRNLCTMPVLCPACYFKAVGPGVGLFRRRGCISASAFPSLLFAIVKIVSGNFGWRERFRGIGRYGTSLRQLLDNDSADVEWYFFSDIIGLDANRACRAGVDGERLGKAYS